MVTFGPKECEVTLRAMLATGADRAIRVEAEDEQLDGWLVARCLKKLVEQEKPETERGLYLHPEAWGRPAQEGIDERERARARALHAPALQEER